MFSCEEEDKNNNVFSSPSTGIVHKIVTLQELPSSWWLES
jgi:hypothetical protein